MSEEEFLYDRYIFWLNEEMSYTQRVMVAEYQYLLSSMYPEKYGHLK